jgi:AcrR family transcriptional regulator
MKVEDRREQLLAVAEEQFGQHPYAEVHMEHIAAAAGVSLGLLYHHFNDKQTLFAAVVDQAIDDLGAATEPDPTLDPRSQLLAALEGYRDYIERHEHAYRAMHRGSQSGDARIRDALERNTQRQVDRICVGLLGTTDAPPQLRLALRGWLAFAIATCLDWLDLRAVDADQLRTMNLHALVGAISGAYATDDPEMPAMRG